MKIAGSLLIKKLARGCQPGLFALYAVVLMTGCVTPEHTAAQNMADPGYHLGPEDVVMISVWKDENLTREAIVRPDGMVSFPLIGDVPAMGHTVEEVRQDIAKRLARFIPNPHVSVAITKLQSYKVYVMGRVTKPGEYLVGHYTDVLQALSLAGGLTPFASENDIKIIRRENGDQRVFLFRYGDVQKGRDLNQNILLERGDVVMVP
ncbi:MAG: polysaccharide biosynthesis/export family protein [Nitrospira sp.]